MKKILIPIVMAAMTLVCASAVNVQTNVKNVQETSINQTDDGFKTVKLEELNTQVQAAIKGYDANYTIKSLTYNAEKSLTKVTLISKTDSKEKVVILNAEGKEVKDDKTVG